MRERRRPRESPRFDDPGAGLENVSRDSIGAPTLGTFEPSIHTTPNVGRRSRSDGCCGETELAVAKEMVGPVRVQIVFCEHCDSVIEKVVGDE